MRELTLYYYRAIGGMEIPSITTDSIGVVQKRFQDSATPITRIMYLFPSHFYLIRQVLEAQLSSTPDSEAGLRFSLETVINALKVPEPE